MKNKVYKPYPKKRQKSVFNAYCPTCGADLGTVTSNLKYTQKIETHNRHEHYGLGV